MLRFSLDAVQTNKLHKNERGVMGNLNTDRISGDFQELWLIFRCEKDSVVIFVGKSLCFKYTEILMDEMNYLQFALSLG